MASTLFLGSRVGFVRGAENSSGNCTEAKDVCQKFSDFWQAWNIAQDRFVDPKAVDPDKMIPGAINGMLDALGDQRHTFYMTKEQNDRWQEELSGSFEGIGAYVDLDSGVPVIVAPIEGSPAEAAGILPGDEILKINGQTTEGMLLNDVISHIKGPKGTQVKLQIRHSGEETTSDITITRAAVVVPAVELKMLPGNVADIRLTQFSENADKELSKVLTEARAQGARSVIMDVRGNPGGLLDQAIKVTGLFIKNGATALIEVQRDGSKKVYRTDNSNPMLDLPMVVLINNGSASSAEIFAGALQDEGRATVIGVPTAGTGTVTQGMRLSDGSIVQLGIAQWQTPKGRYLRREGVSPDVTVGLPATVRPATPASMKKMTDAQILQTPDLQVRRALTLLGVHEAAALAPASFWPR